MGWDDQAEIIAKGREIAPSAFVDKMPLSKVRNVVIDDGPTRVRFRKGPNDNYMFTGQQFYDMFIKPMHEDLHGTTNTWIECFDIDDLMTRHKFPEQKERKDARVRAEQKKKDKGIPVIPLPKYDPESTFCESGIRSKDGTITQLFNIQAVTTNKVLRNKLTTFCAEMLLFDPLAVGRSVIIHHLPTGPLQFIRMHDQAANACLTLHSHNHIFGEADHALAYWTHVYASTREQEVNRPENIEVRSIDSDVLGILCNTVSLLNKEESKEKRTQVYWNRGLMKGGKNEGKPHQLIWINRFVECFEQMNFPIPHLITVAHIFGSDFAKKANLCPRTTFKSAWPTIAKEHKDLAAICINGADLAKRKRFAVWDNIIDSPDGTLLDQFPGFFAALQCHIGTFQQEASDENYEKSAKALEQFVWKFPGCKPGKDVAKGILEVLWATQYHCFPFNLLKVDRPSNFIEVDDC
jgi:hypothetical protein